MNPRFLLVLIFFFIFTCILGSVAKAQNQSFYYQQQQQQRLFQQQQDMMRQQQQQQQRQMQDQQRRQMQDQQRQQQQRQSDLQRQREQQQSTLRQQQQRLQQQQQTIRQQQQQRLQQQQALRQQQQSQIQRQQQLDSQKRLQDQNQHFRKNQAANDNLQRDQALSKKRASEKLRILVFDKQRRERLQKQKKDGERASRANALAALALLHRVRADRSGNDEDPPSGNAVNDNPARSRLGSQGSGSQQESGSQGYKAIATGKATSIGKYEPSQSRHVTGATGQSALDLKKRPEVRQAEKALLAKVKNSVAGNLLPGQRLIYKDIAKGHTRSDGVWDQQFLAKNTKLKSKLDEYASDQSPFGQSVKNLRVFGKTYDQLKKELTERGFRLIEVKTITGKESSVEAPHEFYVHDDGGMVRIKPEGDPGSKKRPPPHVSKCVLYDPKGDSEKVTHWNNEAFKVTDDGYAVPKSPSPKFGMIIRHVGEMQGVYEDRLMDAAHTNLPKWGEK